MSSSATNHAIMQDMTDDPWNTPELIAFRLASRVCYLAGNDYRTLKEIIATEDELTPFEQRKIYPPEAD